MQYWTTVGQSNGKLAQDVAAAAKAAKRATNGVELAELELEQKQNEERLALEQQKAEADVALGKLQDLLCSTILKHDETDKDNFFVQTFANRGHTNPATQMSRLGC